MYRAAKIQRMRTYCSLEACSIFKMPGSAVRDEARSHKENELACQLYVDACLLLRLPAPPHSQPQGLMCHEEAT